MTMASWQFCAVVIKTDSSKPDRLYCDREGRPILWTRFSQAASETAAMLTANGLKASAMDVEVCTIASVASGN